MLLRKHIANPKGIVGEGVFRIATLSALALITLYFCVLFFSMMAYTSGKEFFSALASPEILFSIRLSLMTATISTIISLLIAVPAAYAISRSTFPGKDIIDTILDLPIVLSPIALGAALLVFFNTGIGSAIEKGLMQFVFEVPGIVLAQFTIVNALAIRLLKTTFDGINHRYEQVGRTLGYTKTETFFKVTLPLARNGIIAAAVLTWARAVGEFGATVTLAGATKMKTATLPVAIYLNLATADVEKAIALIFVLIVIALAALIILRKATARQEPL